MPISDLDLSIFSEQIYLFAVTLHIFLSEATLNGAQDLFLAAHSAQGSSLVWLRDLMGIQLCSVA